jgi:hypothetical protein
MELALIAPHKEGRRNKAALTFEDQEQQRAVWPRPR